MFIDIKNHVCSIKEITNILSDCVYDSRKKNLINVIKQYQLEDNMKLYLYLINKVVVGLIGIKADNTACVIKHIAVKQDCRNNGIGSAMITELKNYYLNHVIIAETDDEAVDFYRKYGFEINNLGELYPGVIRYKCSLR